MCLLVFLLGSAALAAATENGSGPGVFLSRSKMLVLVISPPTHLDLSGRDIRSLNSLAFRNCTSVRTLDLSSNWINELSPGIFSDMPNLEHLSLAYNELKSKSMVGAFRNLTNLKSLDLTHNPLSKILNNKVFVGLPDSCEINIRGLKNLRTITPAAFRKTKKRGPKNQKPAGESKIQKPASESNNQKPARESKNEKPAGESKNQTPASESKNQTPAGESKNQKPASESKNCTLRSSDLQEMFDRDKIQIRELVYWDNVVKMCTDDTILRFIDFSNVSDTRNCNDILLNEDMTIINMESVGISSFDNGWFRMRSPSVNSIYISGIFPYVSVKVTGDVLNDLPESIRVFSFTGHEIKGLNKGVMFNEHLRDLSLRGNSIGFIEEDTFAGLKLARLDLSANPLMSLDYVSTLPKTLLWLNLDVMPMRAIPEESFSRMENLLVLSMADSDLRGLDPPLLDGLASLRWLNLSSGKLKYLRPGVFRRLSQLHSLNLAKNNIARFDKGAFDGLACLAKLDLQSNRLESLAGGVFDGFDDSLEMLDLSNNFLETLEAGTFVDAPKFNLSLQENNIRKIERHTFDLPYLMNLDLRYNDLTTIEAGAAKRLGILANKTEVKLGFNPIERLEKGALAGLSSEARVNLAMTPIKVIQSGVFEDS